MERTFRQKLIAFVTFIGGLYFFLEFVLPPEVAGFKPFAFHEQISSGLVAIGGMAIGLGLINIFAVHGGRVVFLRSGWAYSVALLLGFFLMFVVTILDWRSNRTIAASVNQIYLLKDFAQKIESDAKAQNKDVLPVAARDATLERAAIPLLSELEQRSVAAAASTERAGKIAPDLQQAIEQVKIRLSEKQPNGEFSSHQAVAESLSGLGSVWYEILGEQEKVSSVKRLYRFLYNGLFVSLGAAMFSLLGFYIASAAYRAFRVRSAESALMMIAAVLVMLGQIPFGLWIWGELPEIRQWLLSVPSAAAFRAIRIGASIAALVMAYRMWFSIESERFDRSREPRA